MTYRKATHKSNTYGHYKLVVRTCYSNEASIQAAIHKQPIHKGMLMPQWTLLTVAPLFKSRHGGKSYQSHNTLEQ